MSQDPRMLRQAKLSEAVTALNETRFLDARRAAEAVLQMNQNDAAAWGILAFACRGAGALQEALAAADRSLALEPNNPRAYVVKGDTFQRLGNPRAAAAYYREALRFRDPHGALPEGIRADLAHAEAQVQALDRSFQGHLHEHVRSHIEGPGCSERMRQAVALLEGRRRVYYPEPQHLMYPGLPIHEFYPREPFPWLTELEQASETVLEELKQLLESPEGFEPYLYVDQTRPVFDAHGMANNPDWSAFYLWKNGEPVTENQARCPRTTEAITKVPLVFSGKRCPNVLFSRLKARARIAPHTGMINTRLIGHLPLIIPEGCGFRVGNEIREWAFGEAWLFDDTIEHEAWNQHAEEDRFILIFEVWKPELEAAERDLVTSMLTAVDAYGDGEKR